MVAGERVEVDVVKEGREQDQGVGYLEDGTMLVVEGGRQRVGQRVLVTVRSVIQTASGRMVFAQVDDEGADIAGQRRPRRRGRAEGTPTP